MIKSRKSRLIEFDFLPEKAEVKREKGGTAHSYIRERSESRLETKLIRENRGDIHIDFGGIHIEGGNCAEAAAEEVLSKLLFALKLGI